MNVTFYGPKGYDYQYYASAYLILYLWNDDSTGMIMTEAYIDKAGHEDLLLTLTNHHSGEEVNLEFECKDRMSEFDQFFLRDALSKFTAGRDDSFILSRLYQASLNFICFFTSARATSNIEELKLIGSENNVLQPRKGIPKTKAAAFGKLLADNFSKQADGRGKFGASFLSGLIKDEFVALLEKVSVIDQHNHDMVIFKIGIVLNSLGVAEVNHKNVIESLYNLVKGSAKSGINILPGVKEIVNAVVRRTAPLGPNYIHRPIESTLISDLRAKHFLLLEGVSLCGKTQVAYAIANQLLKENESFEYQVKMDIASADQFLFENTTGGKICYLEDPFGHSLDAVDSNLVKKLNNLIENVAEAKGKLLIVTCNSEIVDYIRGGSLYVNQWHNLTISDRSFLSDAWATFSSEEAVPKFFTKQVKILLETLPEKELFQLGQLRVLAILKVSKGALSTEQITNKANVKAQDVAQSLKKNHKRIRYMLLLGAAATTQTGLNDNDLNFILHSSPDYLPGFNKTDPRSIGGTLKMGDGASDFKIKNYKNPIDGYKMEQIHESISILIDLNYVTFADNQYFFAHPIYQEAARLLLADKNVLRFNESLNFLTKIIGGLNEKAALQAVKSLYIIFNGQRTDMEKRKLLDLAKAAGKSTFVTVRDESALFLANQFHLLDNDQQKDFIRTFRRKSDFADNIFRWDGEVVFIPEVDNIPFNLEFLTYRTDPKILQEKWDRYVSEKAVLSPRNAFALLSGLIDLAEHQSKVSFDITSLRDFLEYQQLFIREMAVFLIAASLNDNTFTTLDTITFEDNPYIKYHIIRGLFRSYPHFKKTEVRNNANLFLKSTFDDPFVVIRAIPLFTQFASAHASDSFDWMETITPKDEDQMWELWGELMPIFFKQLPANVHINFARFHGTLLEAKVGTRTKGIILLAYTTWLRERLTEQFAIPEIADIFINVFYHQGPNLDSNTLRQLIAITQQVQISLFREKFLRAAIGLWDKFDEDVRNDVLTFLGKISYRGKIMAFTTQNATKQVQQLVAGKSIVGLAPERVVSDMPESFVLDCLVNIYELEETAEYFFVDRKFWGRVLNGYLLKPDSACFQIALYQYLYEVCVAEKTGSYFPRSTTKYLRELAALINSDEKAVTVALEVLITLMVESDHKKIKNYADILLSHFSEEHRVRFMAVVNEHLSAFGREDKLALFPDIIHPQLEKLIKPELDVYNLQKEFKETKNPALGYRLRELLINA
ncbi:hypothetical protein [Pedobacter sp. KLB.chiD]|uniref:nSTAND3 domain-containing NTPase n=1 Tax=Pedobacter sp. KLB.chiD TaxID=3387402 RepID=UPI00399A3FBB